MALWAPPLTLNVGLGGNRQKQEPGPVQAPECGREGVRLKVQQEAVGRHQRGCLPVTGSHWPQREVAPHGAAEGQPCPGSGWTEDDSGVRKRLLLSPGLGFWAAFCPALCKHQVRWMRNQLWALLVSTSPPSACWFLPELPAPPRPWLWALWSGPGPERTVPFLCPYSLAGSVPALHWASAQPQGHCCSHTGAR